MFQLFDVAVLDLARMHGHQNRRAARQWARRLRELEVDCIVIDPVSPILSSANLDENASTGVRQLLDS